MHANERNDPSRTALLSGAPGRMLVAAATALLLATLIASSTAHALMLGEASAQSALGSPLRVVIPITAGGDELLQPGCFSVGPAPGEGSASLVTASVNLERAAAPRLVVTTPNAVNEPAIRFSVHAGCEGSTERAYVLLLDPSEAAGAESATMRQAVREPRQERLSPRPAATRRTPAGPAVAQAPMPRLIEVVDRGPAVAVPAPVTAPETPAEPAVHELAAPAAPGPSPFRQVAATQASALPALSPLPPRAQPVAPSKTGGSYSDWYLVAVALAIAGVIALVALFTGRRRTPSTPQWTRNPTFIDTRSFTELSAGAVTLPHTHSHAGATTTRGGAASAKPKSTLSKPAGPSSQSSRPTPTQIDPSAIDTLLDAIDSDFVEERAVREAWAAARSDVERELDGNAILQAIEAAERDLHLAPPAPAQAAIERALEDDLLQPQRRHEGKTGLSAAPVGVAARGFEPPAFSRPARPFRDARSVALLPRPWGRESPARLSCPGRD
jgi:hypothetical protein